VRAILPRSDWVVLSACGTDDGDEVKIIHHFTARSTPHDAVQENGTYGGQGKAVRRVSERRRLCCLCARFDLDQCADLQSAML
jgi:hypothetical protein